MVTTAWTLPPSRRHGARELVPHEPRRGRSTTARCIGLGAPPASSGRSGSGLTEAGARGSGASTAAAEAGEVRDGRVQVEDRGVGGEVLGHVAVAALDVVPVVGRADDDEAVPAGDRVSLRGAVMRPSPRREGRAAPRGGSGSARRAEQRLLQLAPHPLAPRVVRAKLDPQRAARCRGGVREPRLAAGLQHVLVDLELPSHGPLRARSAPPPCGARTPPAPRGGRRSTAAPLICPASSRAVGGSSPTPQKPVRRKRSRVSGPKISEKPRSPCTTTARPIDIARRAELPIPTITSAAA